MGRWAGLHCHRHFRGRSSTGLMLVDRARRRIVQPRPRGACLGRRCGTSQTLDRQAPAETRVRRGCTNATPTRQLRSATVSADYACTNRTFVGADTSASRLNERLRRCDRDPEELAWEDAAARARLSIGKLRRRTGVRRGCTNATPTHQSRSATVSADYACTNRTL